MPRFQTEKARELWFWDKVALTSNPDKCWEWQGSLNDSGYGNTSFKCKGIKAHRLAWFYVSGSHSTKHILHSCDNRKCVNPKHLREGVQADNSRDMVDRRRHFRHSQKQCIHGHDWTSSESIKVRMRRGRSERICVECSRRRSRDYARRIREIQKLGL